MKFNYKMENLGCANCASRMEDAIRKMDGIASVKIIFMTARLTIEADESQITELEEKMEKTIRKIESDVKLKRV
jgi:Cation transport ATPase